MSLYIIIALAVGGVFVVGLGLLVMVKTFFRMVHQGQALVINSFRGTSVSFTGALVYPVINKAELMDISVKTIEVDRSGKDGLICADNIRADIKVTFFVRVAATIENVKKVASAVGCERASHQDTMENLFAAKFSEALKTVGYNMEFVALYNKRDEFKDAIIECIGTDLNGYHVDDAAIDYLEQTPLTALDPDNILDANGITKITELTTIKHVETNKKENVEKQEITRQNVEAKKIILEQQRDEALAEATQKREVANAQAEAEADIQVERATQKQRAEQARIESEKNIALNDVAMRREIEVAQKKREANVAQEQERVIEAKNLEAIRRTGQENVNRAKAEKEVEETKKATVEVIAQRVALDKGVAQEEERIKDLRAFAGAERQKKVVIVTAEGEAQKGMVKDIVAAEAREKAATHLAKERIINAEANLDAVDKETRATIRRSEGVQAETAASGLGEVRVKEADAVAREKLGMADVHVKDADADATQKVGLAEAKVLEQKMLAEAKGIEEKGMAGVRVSENEAAAIEKRGLAEATAIREKLTSEATGLGEKAAAMKALDESGRGHEEFRIELEVKEKLQREQIKANESIAKAQAQTLAEAFKNTKIDIVGGDGEFFQRFINAVSWGKSFDGLVDKSDRAQTVLKGYLDGDESLTKDLRDVLSRPALGSDDVQKLTVSAVLGSLLKAGGSKSHQSSIKALLDKAKDLGIDDLPLG